MPRPIIQRSMIQYDHQERHNRPIYELDVLALQDSPHEDDAHVFLFNVTQLRRLRDILNSMTVLEE